MASLLDFLNNQTNSNSGAMGGTDPSGNPSGTSGFGFMGGMQDPRAQYQMQQMLKANAQPIKGTRGGAWASALSNLLQGYLGGQSESGYQDYVTNKDMNQAKLDDMKQQITQRDLANTRAGMLFDEQKRYFQSKQPQAQQAPQGDGLPSAAQENAPINTPTSEPFGGGNPSQGGGNSPQGGNSNLVPSLQDLTRESYMQLPGVDERRKLLEYSQTPQKYDQGSTYIDRLTGKMTNLPKLGEGMQTNPDGSVSLSPQYLQSLAAITGTQELAKQGASARFDISTLNRPDGTTVQIPRDMALGSLRGAATPMGQAPQAAMPPVQNDFQFKNPQEAESYRQLLLQQPDSPTRNMALMALSQPKSQSTQQTPQAQGPQLGVTGDPAKLSQAKVFSDAVGKGNADYATNLASKVDIGNTQLLSMVEKSRLLNAFTPGAGADTRGQIAAAAQSMGMPPDMVNGINRGDLASKQAFQKLATRGALEDLRAAVDGNKINRNEFQVFSENNPNLTNDPNAIKKMYDFMAREHQKNVNEFQAYNQAVNVNGTDPTQFRAQYSNDINNKLMTQFNQNQSGAPKNGFKILSVQ